MAERPAECSQCKRNVKVIYKEIVGDSMLCFEMCAECPILQQKLHGTPSEGAVTALCCEKCHTSLESIETGGPLGCSECSAVFAEPLLSNLISTGRLPARLIKTLSTKRSAPLHVGKAPGKAIEIAPSSRLTSLNEALNEALKRENYEQAAWLRDQIKALEEKNDEGK